MTPIARLTPSTRPVLRGAFTALVTPFTADGAVDECDESGERDGELCVLCEWAAAVEDGCEGSEGDVFL